MASPILAAAGEVGSLQLGTSEYLSGTIGTAPTFPFAEVTGVVSSAVLTGEDWINVTDQNITFVCGTTLISGNDYYSLPPASLQVTLPASYSVLYAHKTASGLSAYSTTIDLLATPDATTAQEALEDAQSSITGVYVPLAVLSGDDNGDQTLIWSVSQNAAYSAPILNQLVLVGNFEQNAKNFLSSQFTALYNDLVNFAQWSTGWINTPFQANFNMPESITNYVNPINWGGEGVQGVTYTGNSINVNCFTRTLSMCLIGLAWGTEANNGNTAAWQGWSDAFDAPLIYQQYHGSLEPQFADLIPNFSSYTGNNYYYAPSVDLGLQGALITNIGNSVGPGSTYWQKTVIWSAEDGNLYTHVGASMEYDLGVPYSLVIPSGITIRLMDGDTGEEVTSMPVNPLASPTFDPAWQGGTTSEQSTTSTTPSPVIPSTTNSSAPTSSTSSTTSTATPSSSTTTSSNSANTSAPSTSLTVTTTPQPFTDYTYAADFSTPQNCYLVFTANGSWSVPSSYTYYVVNGLSTGLLTLEPIGTDFPTDAMEFTVSVADPGTLSDSAATFTIQNTSTGEYLGGNTSQGFAWYTSTGSETVFSTQNAYSGEGFGMNIAYSTANLKCQWFTPDGTIPSGYMNQWTYWAQLGSGNSDANAVKLKSSDDTKESKK